jgi:hypothetical protein
MAQRFGPAAIHMTASSNGSRLYIHVNMYIHNLSNKLIFLYTYMSEFVLWQKEGG